eukprot:TRINITY_DN62541_c2_g1_i1.p2 TRINITY_DN62541_c2_g1~~TRINITY_DN62541_c2_g1_i1.p2  ORF type:complete len:103 (+),score=16.10 TRINITY_DN62541_c2_g1_i1:40-348(+)
MMNMISLSTCASGVSSCESTPQLKTGSDGFSKEELQGMLAEEAKIRNSAEFENLQEWAGEAVGDKSELMWVQKVVLKKFGFACDQETVASYANACGANTGSP